MSKTIKLTLSGTGLLLAILLIVPLAMADFMPNPVVQNLSQTQTDAGFPAIALSPDGKKIGVVWAERYPGGESLQGPIYFRAGDRDNAQFSEKTAVDFSVTVDDQSKTPDIASDPSGTMHIVWRNLKGNISRIYYATCNVTIPVTAEQADCDADADHFEIDQADSTAAVTVNAPAVAANLGDIAGTHVVWNVHDGGSDSESIYYSGRDKDGSWPASPSPVGSGIQPAIATAVSGGDDYVHVVWVDGQDVKYRRGVDDTVPADGVADSWTPIQSLPAPSSFVASYPGYPQVVALTDTVVVMWDVFAGQAEDYEGPQPADDLYHAVYAVSYDNGANFSTTALNVTSGNTSYTDRRSDNNPSDTNNALRGTGHAERLQLSAAIDPEEGISGTVHLAWHQTAKDGAAYYHDIFYSVYGPYGEGVYDWKSDHNPALNETDANGTYPNGTLGKVDETTYFRAYSTAPDIAVAPGNEEGPAGEVHMVYMEGDQNGTGTDGYEILDPDNEFTFNVYYTNNIGEFGDACNPDPDIGLLCMKTPDVGNTGAYLPILLKNSQ
jgi:hypothetical protein